VLMNNLKTKLIAVCSSMERCERFSTCEAQGHRFCIERQPYLALLLTQYVPDLHRVSRLQLFISSYACISAATGARSRCFKKVLAAKSECSPLSSVPTPTPVPPIQHSCLPCSCPWPCLTLAPHLSTSLEHLTNRPVCKDQECKAQPCALCKCSTLVTSACACA